MADISPPLTIDEQLARAEQQLAELSLELSDHKEMDDAMDDMNTANDSDELGRAEYRFYMATERRTKKEILRDEARIKREAKRQEKLILFMREQLEKERLRTEQRKARQVVAKEKRRAYYLAHPEQSKQRYQANKAAVLERQKKRYDEAKIINVRTQCPTCGKSLLTNSIPPHIIRFHAAVVAPAVV